MSPSIAFGGLVGVFGIVMLILHSTTWRSQREDGQLAEEERAYLWRRYRRRMQTSGLLVLIGVMIPLGDEVLPMKESPGWFTVYWGVVLLATMWVAFLGVGDLLTTTAHSRRAMARVDQKRRELEHEIEQLTNLRQK